jgi:hypothetical protein
VPIFFNYRHGIELTLKRLIREPTKDRFCLGSMSQDRLPAGLQGMPS